MMNLLAILVSMAMMLTGAGMPGETVALEAPVARTLTISNIAITCNDETVNLTPTASFGVMTDGKQAVYDFFVESDGEKLLPFQLVADESGLLLTNDNSNTTLQLSAEEIDQVMQAGVQQAPVSDDPMMKFITEEYFPAYMDLIKMATDKEQSKAFTEAANQAVEGMIDRGEGVPGQIEYDGETIDVTTYTYSLDSVQLGRIADAVYASNETTSRFLEVYFKLLNMAAADTPEMQGIDSMEKLFEKINTRLDIVEHQAADGLVVVEGTIVIQVPDTEEAIEIPMTAVQKGDYSAAEVTMDFAQDGASFRFYMQAEQDGDDKRISMNMAADEAAPQQADIEADGAEVEGDGETDDADMIYLTCDGYNQGDPDTGDTNFGISMTAEVRDQGSFGFDFTGAHHEDGTSEGNVKFGFDDPNQSLALSFDLTIDNTPFEVRADAANAIGLSQLDAQALNPLQASVTADAINLSLNESVQQALSLFMATGAPEVVEDVDDGDYDSEGREAEPYDDGELPFNNPEFTWLPEGYVIANTDVDTQYDMVDVMLTNAQNTSTMYVFISAPYGESETHTYMLNGDEVSEVEGRIITRSIDEGSSNYSTSDDRAAISVYVDSDGVAPEDVCRMIAGITY